MPRDAVHVWATLDDWNTNRSLITRLYIDERKTLKNVMVIMQRDHSFFATIKMYKSRFEQWGLRKSLTARDVPYLLQHVQQAQQGGSQASADFVVIRGRQVPLTKVGHYFKRNPSIVLASRSSLSLPTDMAWTDEIARLLRQFIAGSCEGGSWCPDGIRPVFFARQKTLAWLNETSCADVLIEKGLFEQAFACLDVSCDRLKRLLRDPDPTLFIYLYHVLTLLPDAICIHMATYIAELAAILLPEKHPIRHICFRLSQAGNPQLLLDYGSTILHTYFNLLKQSFSENEPSFLNFSRIFYNLLHGSGFIDLEAVVSRHMDIVGLLEVSGGSEEDLLQTHLSTSQILIASGKYDAAEAILGEVGRNIDQMRERPPSIPLQRFYAARRFDLHTAKGSVENAINSGRQNILVAMKMYGATNYRTLVVISDLQLYCTQNGNMDEANRLRDIVESRLELTTYFEDVGMVYKEC